MTIPDYIYKIIIIGDSGTGKTSLLSQAISGKFEDLHNLTIGVEFASKRYILDKSNLDVKLLIWDTAGQEAYRAITKSYYKNISGAIIVFNLTNNKSFKNIQFWMDELKNSCDIKNIPCILVGNKSDLKDRTVTYKDAKNIAKKLGIEYYEISSKNNEQCCKIFKDITEKIAKYNMDNKIHNKINNKKIILNSFPDIATRRPKKCCNL